MGKNKGKKTKREQRTGKKAKAQNTGDMARYNKSEQGLRSKGNYKTDQFRIYTSFVMEDLQIRNMVKNHRYARSIQEATWGMFKTDSLIQG